MTHKDGILSALDTSISLEDKIRTSIYEVVSNHRPRDRYPDREDKHNVVQRELIVTTLEAIFEHHSEQLKSDEEGATVQTSESPDPFIELFSAFRNIRKIGGGAFVRYVFVSAPSGPCMGHDTYQPYESSSVTYENTTHRGPNARRASVRRALGPRCVVFSYV